MTPVKIRCIRCRAQFDNTDDAVEHAAWHEHLSAVLFKLNNQIVTSKDVEEL